MPYVLVCLKPPPVDRPPAGGLARVPPPPPAARYGIFGNFPSRTQRSGETKLLTNDDIPPLPDGWEDLMELPRPMRMSDFAPVFREMWSRLRALEERLKAPPFDGGPR